MEAPQQLVVEHANRKPGASIIGLSAPPPRLDSTSRRCDAIRQNHTPFVGKLRIARTKQSEAFRVESCSVLKTAFDRTAQASVSDVTAQWLQVGWRQHAQANCTCTPACFEAMLAACDRLHLEGPRILQEGAHRRKQVANINATQARPHRVLRGDGGMQHVPMLQSRPA